MHIIKSALFIFCAVILMMFVLQRHLLYHPDKTTPDPDHYGLAHMRVVTLTTVDNLNLKAWYHPAKPGKPTVVYYHGNAGHLGHRAMIAKDLMAHGYGMLLVSYRGYAGNPGSPSEQGLYNDARAAMNFIQAQQVPLQCVILYGESLGTGVAVEIAEENKIGALVLQSPYTQISDVALRHYPFLYPFIYIPGLVQDEYASINKINYIHDTPLLIMHGKSDHIVPYKLGQTLYDKAVSPKQFIGYQGAGHNNMPAHKMAKAVEAFVQKYKVCQ